MVAPPPKAAGCGRRAALGGPVQRRAPDRAAGRRPAGAPVVERYVAATGGPACATHEADRPDGAGGDLHLAQPQRDTWTRRAATGGRCPPVRWSRSPTSGRRVRTPSCRRACGSRRWRSSSDGGRRRVRPGRAGGVDPHGCQDGRGGRALDGRRAALANHACTGGNDAPVDDDWAVGGRELLLATVAAPRWAPPPPPVRRRGTGCAGSRGRPRLGGFGLAAGSLAALPSCSPLGVGRTGDVFSQQAGCSYYANNAGMGVYCARRHRRPPDAGRAVRDQPRTRCASLPRARRHGAPRPRVRGRPVLGPARAA